MLDHPDAAYAGLLRLRKGVKEALDPRTVGAWATEDDHGDLGVGALAPERADQDAAEVHRRRPAVRANAATAIEQQHEVDFAEAFDGLVWVRFAARVHVARLAVVPLLAVFFRALALAYGRHGHCPAAVPVSVVAFLGATGPVRPLCKLAVHIAGLHVARVGFTGRTAGSAVIFGLHFHVPDALNDATTTLCRARTPAHPGLQHTVYGAGVSVAAPEGLQRWALHAANGVCRHHPCHPLGPSPAGNRALLVLPLGDRAVLEEGRVVVAPHLVELAADLLEAAHLALEGPEVPAAVLPGLEHCDLQPFVLLVLHAAFLAGRCLALRSVREGRLLVLVLGVVALDLLVEDSLRVGAALFGTLEVGQELVARVHNTGLDGQELALELVALGVRAHGAVALAQAVVKLDALAGVARHGLLRQRRVREVRDVGSHVGVDLRGARGGLAEQGHGLAVRVLVGQLAQEHLDVLPRLGIQLRQHRAEARVLE
mmetsp:Transcript_33915/g.96987  ORF Transcript_33915/g.96987 Transcript_33915/m.96987 type:complete len:484 (+) Transcript_33915:577-2028(+)